MATIGISAKKERAEDDLARRDAVGHRLHADQHQREDEGGDDLERDAAAGIHRPAAYHASSRMDSPRPADG